MKNSVFSNSSKYLKELQNININSKQRYMGKSLAVVFPTKLCKAGCEFCFYQSNYETLEFQEKQELSTEAYQKVINFVNETNNGYFMIAGGGEPFEKLDFILESIKKVNTDKIVIATSAYWAKDIRNAKNVINCLIEAKNIRKVNVDIELRISIDQYHTAKLGTKCAENIIELFEENKTFADSITLIFLTMNNDQTPIAVMETFRGYIVDNIKAIDGVKKRRNRYTFVTSKGLRIIVDETTFYDSNLKCDLLGSRRIANSKSKENLLEDILFIKDGNLSVVKHEDGTIGLDYLINYNGNISTWGNYHHLEAPNIYIHNTKEIIEKLYNDILSYTFITKEYSYICNIVSEINQTAVERAKLINIRDYTGSSLLEENKTALYVGIMMLKEYIIENELSIIDLSPISSELMEILQSSKDELLKSFETSEYTIFDQLNEFPFNKYVWDDTFELYELGHYELSKDELTKAMHTYKINDSKSNNKSVYISQNDRLTERFNAMNYDAQTFLKNKYENEEKQVERNECRFCNLSHRLSESIYGHQTSDIPVYDTVLLQTDTFIVVPTLGSIIPGYVLILTKHHIHSMAYLNEKEINELQELLICIKSRLLKMYGIDSIVFEHGGAVNAFSESANSVDHSHIHVVPINFSNEKDIIEEIKGEKIDDFSDLILYRDAPYLLYSNKNDNYVSSKVKFPSQYMRKWIANEVGLPEEWNWREIDFLDNVKKTIDMFNKETV